MKRWAVRKGKGEEMGGEKRKWVVRKGKGEEGMGGEKRIW